MVDVEVLAVMLVGVETTIYGVSMALYVAMKLHLPVPPEWVDRPTGGDEVVREPTWPELIQGYGRYTLASLTAAFGIALVLTLVTLATQNVCFAFLGAAGFGVAYASVPLDPRISRTQDARQDHERQDATAVKIEVPG